MASGQENSDKLDSIPKVPESGTEDTESIYKDEVKNIPLPETKQENIESEFSRSCQIDDENLVGDTNIADIEIDKTLDWFIDEEDLKLTEKDLTPEEKQLRRDAADQLKTEGNELFGKALYPDAARAYTRALRTCPYSCGNERAILYSNRAACFLYMEEKEEGVMDCSKALEYNPNYLKAILRRAILYEKNEKLDEALADYNKVLELEPHNPKAMEACMRLPSEIKEKNEKLKTEMLGKLKDLGNMFLRPFGMSTDNFKVQQDPSTGSYSINVQQNK